jgi:hypothetical protein
LKNRLHFGLRKQGKSAVPLGMAGFDPAETGAARVNPATPAIFETALRRKVQGVVLVCGTPPSQAREETQCRQK